MFRKAIFIPIIIALFSAMVSFSFFTDITHVINDHNISVSNNPTNHYDSNAAEDKPEKGFWHVFFHDPIAFFTGVLAIFTIILAFATVGLIVITRRGIRDQSEIANTALKHSAASAAAALQTINSDRAWVCYDNMTTAEDNNAAVAPGITGPLVGIFINYINTGKSPCLIKSIYARGMLIDIRDDTPIFDAGEDKLTRPMIKGPGQIFGAAMQKMLGDEVFEFKKRQKKFVIYSRVIYDSLGAGATNKHTEICIELFYNGEIINPDNSKRINIRGILMGDQNSAS